MRFLLHRLAHLLKINRGRKVTFHLNRTLMIAFRCDSCGELEGLREANRETR